MKRFLISAILCVGCIISLYAKDISVGWGIYGFSEDVNLTQKFDASSGVKVIWKYDNTNGWYAYSPHEYIKSEIISKEYKSFDNVNIGEGVWILSDVNISTNIESLEKSLAKVIVGASNGLSGAGLGASASVNAVSTSLPSFGSGSAKVLASVIVAPTSFNFANGYYSSSMNILDTNATVSFDLYDGNSVLTSSNILSSEAFGVSDIQSLGTILQGISSDETQAITDLLGVGNSIVTTISTYSSYPGFEFLNEDFKSFSTILSSTLTSISGFPDSTQISAIKSILNSADTVMNNVDVNWSRLSILMQLEFDENLSVNGLKVEFNPLIADKMSFENILSSPITFKTSGKIYTNSVEIEMNNVEINTSISNPNSISGSYKIAQIIDGKSITGNATFNEQGCTGANIYADDIFIGRVLLENGNFYLVDENNNKLDTILLN